MHIVSRTLSAPDDAYPLGNSGRVVTVVSLSATNWEAQVKTGFESWWQSVEYLNMLKR